MAELDSASFPKQPEYLRLAFHPGTPDISGVLQMHPDRPFRALISASDRRNVKRGRQYHLGLREWFSSGSQKIGEKKKTSEPIMFCYSRPFKVQFSTFLNQTEAGEVDSDVRVVQDVPLVAL